MGLEKYQQKRDFDKTPEPAGSLDHSGQYRFVIQRHDARRLHYDLRLEMKGVLKSWAIPKGPSMNPADKRLAIHTEDHPLEYLTFQGTIPKGNYGAGKMIVWDQGRFESYKAPNDPNKLEEEYEQGTLHLLFHGQRTKGKFTLVRTNYSKKDQWLLIKQEDTHSTNQNYDAEDQFLTTSNQASLSGTTQEALSPMLATTGKTPFDHPDWLFELKYDGYRILANVVNRRVNLYSRNNISYTNKFPQIVQSLSSISHDALLDGEMVILNSEGIPQFQDLQNYDKNQPGDLRYMVFDLLHLDGHSTLKLPLIQRKELLSDLLPALDHILFTDHLSEKGTSLYKEAVKMGIEGIMAKKADSRYHPGIRSNDWLKIKKFNTADLLICGYTESDKSNRPFGSLMLGSMEEGQLKYRGQCGSGFSGSKMTELFRLFQSYKRQKSPFHQKINLNGRIPHWLEPKLVCEVKYSEITSKGRFRHPVFLRMRPDKTLKMPPAIAFTPSEPKTDSGDGLEVNGIHLTLSNLEKVYWSQSGIRKYDLLDYYIAVSEVMLPHLVGRPQNLHRHPDGIDEPGFYQKDVEHAPDWLQTIKIYSESSKKHINYLLCQNEAALLYMVNLGCIEINPWLSQFDHIEYPDYTVIDLDPAPNNSFDEVVEVALVIKEILEISQVAGFPKTSGSRGIHIYIPLGGEYTFEESRDFAQLICILTHRKRPDITTMERSLKKRGPKIYLDYLQNRRGQTIAAPYSVRPVPGALVSAPVTWGELEEGVTLQDFTIDSIPERIEEKNDLFAATLSGSLDMMQALGRLERQG